MTEFKMADQFVMDKAAKEYMDRLDEAKALAATKMPDELRNMYYTIPVCFPRQKHIAKMAWDISKK